MSDRAYYYVLKDEARRRTVAALNKRLLRTGNIAPWDRLTLCSVMGTEVGDALHFAATEWPEHYGPGTHTGFSVSWEKLAYRFWHEPDHFDLAIWQHVGDRPVLVALALGSASHARTHLTVKWVERYFGPNQLAGRALFAILTCAEEYAKLLGSKRVLVKDAVDPAKYGKYGYTPYYHPNVAYGGNYLGKEL